MRYVERLGTSSIVYRVGIFQGDQDGDGALAAAEGRFVHVRRQHRSGAADDPAPGRGPRGPSSRWCAD